MRCYLGFAKYGISLWKFKSEVSLKENCKCPLEHVNPSVKHEGLVWKHWYSATSRLGLNLKKKGCKMGLSQTTINLEFVLLFFFIFSIHIQLFFIILLLICLLHLSYLIFVIIYKKKPTYNSLSLFSHSFRHLS